MKKPLEKYRAKRDFRTTKEPEGSTQSEKKSPLRFVVQMHHARRLHWDFRLECDGVLKSWAVPKGPSYDPSVKRLAVHVEDHPLEYADFEGTIPKGQYGGGEVILWDEGAYAPDEEGDVFDDRDEAERQVREGLKKGKIGFTLKGHKLQGSWALVEMKGEENQWLLIKHQDAFASETRDALADERSVRSGRVAEDLKNGTAPKKPLPILAPMVPTELERPFTNEDWAFELKLDGIRALANIEHHSARIFSRNQNDITAKFPALLQSLLQQPDAVFDGEIVAYDPEGRPSFQTLMQRFQGDQGHERADSEIPVQYCVFDLLFLNGEDLRTKPFRERRKLLEETLLPCPLIRLVDLFPETGELLFDQARKMGFEGIIGKKLDSRYVEGRSSHWIKVKGYRSDEFVIGGCTHGAGYRSKTFGALILGRWEDGKLHHVGNCGGGLSDVQTEELRTLLESLETEHSPFDKPIEFKTREKPTWVEPKRLAEVRYQSLTRDGKLRFPIFLRLRPDLEGTEKLLAKSNRSPMKLDDLDTTGSEEADSVLEQLQSSEDDLTLRIGGHKLHVTSLSRVYWPHTPDHPAYTKRDLLIYYAKISEAILPHLHDRPLSLGRFPDGIEGERFFQKHWEGKLPEYFSTVDIYSKHRRRVGEYLLCNNLPSLLWMGQMGVLEIHPWYSRVTPEEGLGVDFSSSEEALEASVLNYPDFMVFDLDPYLYSGNEASGAEPELNREAFQDGCFVALETKKLLESAGLTSFIKTSGKTGLHLYVPIERIYSYEAVRNMAATIGRHLLEMYPQKITMEWSVEKRKGKVFFDHNQNTRGKTLASIYSPRPSATASVSFPIDWIDLEKIYPPEFHLLSAPELIAKNGDLWRDLLQNPQRLQF